MKRFGQAVCAFACALVAGIALLGNAAAQQRPSGAQAYPEKPVRMIVPAASGSGPDAMGRLLGAKLSESWGQPIIVENIAGAGGNIGHERGARAAPDGYTLLMGLIASMSIADNLSFDPVKDLAPVTLLIKTPNILVVHPSVPAANLGELIAYAKKNPGKLRYGTPGSTTSIHLASEYLNMSAGIKTEGVVYKSTTQMTTDLIGGHFEMMFHNAGVVIPHIRAGAMRAIAITSAQRSSAAADIPTFNEAGLPGYEATAWYAMYVPSGTSQALIARLNADFRKVLALPDVQTWIAAQAGAAGGGTPEALAAFQAAETKKWKTLIKAAGIKTD